MANFKLLSFGAADDLARAAADAWLDEIETANRSAQPHTVALSGGRIAQKFFAETVARATARNTSFDRVHFFWADERCVPPDDAESNFKTARELLLAPLKIAEDRVHRLRGEDPPEAAAEIAGNEIRQVVARQAQGMPSLDLVILGMGEDGHIASLFPGISAGTMDISAPFLVVHGSPKPPPTRISLSFRAIFAAEKVWVLASGTGKAAALRASLSSNAETPLAKVIQTRQATIFSDIIF